VEVSNEPAPGVVRNSNARQRARVSIERPSPNASAKFLRDGNRFREWSQVIHEYFEVIFKMSNESGKRFTGFTPQTLEFLKTLLEQNNKLWFERHKSEYQDEVRAPFKNLVTELREPMLYIDPLFETQPAVNKTISRIYRDTRFSRDKSLFRGNVWLVFKRPGKDWIESPAFFFELFPDWYRFGMGFYQASRGTMDAFRREIDEWPDHFAKAVSFFSHNDFYSLHADAYKRTIPNNHPQEWRPWYQSKTFYLSSDREIDELIFSSRLVAELIFGFHMLKPLYQFLLAARSKVGG